jgi:hypothetical protein
LPATGESALNTPGWMPGLFAILLLGLIAIIFLRGAFGSRNNG